ncbi:MAG: septation regulator SpoVG [Spirochaetales bacterium]|nr:septation regulator SpoVG [Spirochaetales bacterium]
MTITDVRVRKIESDGKLKAYVTATLDDCFVVHNIKVIEGRNGKFIAMPSRKTKNGEYKDVAHPIHSDFRNDLQEKVLSAYEQALLSDEEEVCIVLTAEV